MADRSDKEQIDDTKILGDINPEPKHSPDAEREIGRGTGSERDEEMERASRGGSNEDRTEHSGSRDVTEGTTGGTGAEVGGTRNYRTGSGATGTDIGNRPE
jgi:hypothetical protein